uniref:Uncharacterized protein n=1 Tax=Tetraselmis chuii TaxID=63592 RepID=A0A7S1X7B5_9CHLO|mmetsp:Transcript_36045/g.64450  ORF Transcript_36045/g.64450 Transcript_36045/m.64450 type:complete len:185 (+) Transcript_36045:1-555(+)
MLQAQQGEAGGGKQRAKVSSGKGGVVGGNRTVRNGVAVGGANKAAKQSDASPGKGKVGQVRIVRPSTPPSSPSPPLSPSPSPSSMSPYEDRFPLPTSSTTTATTAADTAAESVTDAVANGGAARLIGEARGLQDDLGMRGMLGDFLSEQEALTAAMARAEVEQRSGVPTSPSRPLFAPAQFLLP